MADVLIRNIEDDLLDKLKKKAEANQRSLQAELKKALEEYAGPTKEEVIEMVQEIQERFKSKGVVFPDSTEEIRKMRDSR